jgi:hypothetical protein
MPATLGAGVSAEAWAQLQAGLGAVSGGLVVAPSAVLEPLLRTMDARTANLYRDTVMPVLAAEGVMAVGLLREAYSGRLLGFKTPSLVAAASVPPGFDLNAALPPLLDRWNGAFGLALLTRERNGEDGARFLVIDDARSGIYSSMQPAEKPVLWQVGPWLLMASNLRTAQEVRRRMGQPAGDLPQGAWWPAAADAPGALHCWVDFNAAGTALRNLAALHALVQIAQGERSGPAVALMEDTGRVVSALEPFGEGWARVAMGADTWLIDARVGR